MSLPHEFTTVVTRHFAGYLWNTTWCPARTLVTDGYRDLWVHGGADGDTLYVFIGGCLVDLERGIRTHEDAVQWAIRQFSRTEPRVAA